MPPQNDDREQPFWLRPPTVVAVVGMLTLFRLYIGAHSGLSFDEGYYAFWSERLAIGYLDHPPAVAWLIALGRLIAGNDELGVRLLSVACGLGTSAAIWRIGRLLVDRNSAALAVLWYNLTPALGLGFIMTPDSPSVLCWALTLSAVAEFMASKNAHWWLAAGVLAGLGLWSKYTDAFLAPGLLLLMLTQRDRLNWLKLWQVWAAPVLALAVFSPVIWWNAQYDWASFRLQGRRTVANGVSPDVLGNLLDLLLGQALFVAPILVVFALLGLGRFLRRPGAADRQGLALPVLTGLPALGYFVFHAFHAHVEANWLMPLWPMLALTAAAAALSLRPTAALGKAVLGGLIVLQPVLGLGLTGLVYAQTLFQPFDLGGIDRTDETRGWPKLIGDLDALATANGAKWIATSHNYGVTGQLATYANFARSPLPVRQIDEGMRWKFLPPYDPASLTWPALFVRIEGHPEAPEPPNDLFDTAKLVGVVHRDGGKHPLEAFSAFLVSAPTAKFLSGIAE